MPSLTTVPPATATPDAVVPVPCSLPAVPTDSKRMADKLAALAADVVDVIDLIDGIKSRTPANVDLNHLDVIRLKLQSTLETHDIELIDMDNWTPEFQKPIAIEPAPGGQAATLILKKGSTGLTVSGRIYRKQEVVLSRPTNQPTSVTS